MSDKDLKKQFPGVKGLKSFKSAKKAIEYAEKIYLEHTKEIHKSFDQIVSSKKDISERRQEKLTNLKGATYPFIGINVPQDKLNPDARLSFGVAIEPGAYGGTLTRFDLFKDYYEDQINCLLEHHKCPVVVGKSDSDIPMPFVVDHTPADLSQQQLWELKTGFCQPNLSRINDEVANCTYEVAEGQPRPISLFSAERVDYSLHRLYHYTATMPDHFQGFVLLTNYQRYMGSFIEFAHKQLLDKKSGYTELVTPGNVITRAVNGKIKVIEGEEPPHLPQMPSYHLKRDDGQGITFINIGVGPSNAKNITDHLAVLRPHCWLMLGHCAGLRLSQQLGDYVLAHGYAREDNVLNKDLPPWVPVPPIAEVQLALQDAVSEVFHHSGYELKTEMRTGTVVTTDDRNWELRSKELYERFRQSRAIALDMESATVAANGFRFRVPYGTLLCVSDKPIHGEIKLRGMANEFYRQKVTQHLEVGLESIRILREQGVQQLHSRKLRGFDEPPFR